MEVGPGKGALTHPLLERLKHTGVTSLTLIEKDDRFAEVWQEHKKQTELPYRLDVFKSDFLHLKPEDWSAKGVGRAVLSNLPYSVGTSIAIELAHPRWNISFMVLMLQAEVAQRFYAKPSTPHRGSLSIWFQNNWDVTSVLKVSPEAFRPPPKVESEVILCKLRSSPRIAVLPEHAKRWNTFLRGCFAQRRKMLRSVSILKNALALAEIDGTKRAEALVWEEWERLFFAYQREHQ